jgi:hypothetical protein
MEPSAVSSQLRLLFKGFSESGSLLVFVREVLANVANPVTSSKAGANNP